MPAYQYTAVLGNVGRDPEVRDVNGTKVASFSVAVTEHWTDRSGAKQEKTTWYNASAWQGAADVIAQYVHKGDPIFLTGTTSTRAYIAEDGTPRASLDLRVDKFQLLGVNRSSGSGNGSNEEPAPYTPNPDDIPF